MSPWILRQATGKLSGITKAPQRREEYEATSEVTDTIECRMTRNAKKKVRSYERTNDVISGCDTEWRTSATGLCIELLYLSFQLPASATRYTATSPFSLALSLFLPFPLLLLVFSLARITVRDDKHRYLDNFAELRPSKMKRVHARCGTRALPEYAWNEKRRSAGAQWLATEVTCKEIVSAVMTRDASRLARARVFERRR